MSYASLPMVLISILLWILMLGLSVYGFVLFVRLARRGIRALDIYIDKNNKKQN